MIRSRVADLQVFQRAYAISLEVHRTSLAFPQIEQYALADQVRRASKSICVNLAEGYAEACCFANRVQVLSSNGARLERRDADLVALLLGSWLHRSADFCALVS